MIGQFFTPNIVAECMFHLAGVRRGQRVIDPSCGDGSFLRVAPKGIDLYACEVDPQYANLSKLLVQPKCFVDGDALTSLLELWGTCDLVIGNPPFMAQANLEKRPNVLRGYDLGAGRKSQCLEVLFLELFCKLARPNGRIAIILPDGLFGNRPLKYVRDWLLCRTHVEAIISLPRNTFTKTTAKTNIIIAQKLRTASAPYREPTWLLKCDRLSELKLLKLADWSKLEPRWRRVVLADEQDWRPEAQHASTQGDAVDAVRLGDMFRMRTGSAKYGGEREFADQPGPGRILLIRAKNISPDGGLRLDRNCAYIEQSGSMFREAAVVRPGEILFVRVGAGCYGRTALVTNGIHAQADDWIHVLTPMADVDIEGLVAWFNSEEGRGAVARLSKGVGTLSISKSSLAEIRIPARLRRSSDLILES